MNIRTFRVFQSSLETGREKSRKKKKKTTYNRLSSEKSLTRRRPAFGSRTVHADAWPPAKTRTRQTFKRATRLPVPAHGTRHCRAINKLKRTVRRTRASVHRAYATYIIHHTFYTPPHGYNKIAICRRPTDRPTGRPTGRRPYLRRLLSPIVFRLCTRTSPSPRVLITTIRVIITIRYDVRVL